MWQKFMSFCFGCFGCFELVLDTHDCVSLSLPSMKGDHMSLDLGSLELLGNNQDQEPQTPRDTFNDE